MLSDEVKMLLLFLDFRHMFTLLDLSTKMLERLFPSDVVWFHYIAEPEKQICVCSFCYCSVIIKQHGKFLTVGMLFCLIVCL